MDLYITDLDGTLLDTNELIDTNSVNIINQLISKGLNFTVATARSIISARSVISPLNLKLPVIVHNGAMIFDMIKQTPIQTTYLNPASLEPVMDTFNKYLVYPLVYTLSDDTSSKVYYRGIHNVGEDQYIKSRVNNGDKRFHLVNDLIPYMSHNIITLVAIGTYESLSPLYQELSSFQDITCFFAYDFYTCHYWLEVTHKNANKGDAVLQLKELLQADRLICFGDNLNDMAMFQNADEKYAVENAVPELKAMANKIIPSHTESGVATFLLDRFSFKTEEI